MKHKISNFKYKTLRHCLSFPLLFGMIVPLIFCDICIELYHRVCFPLYGMPIVKRSKYIIIDRHKLSYLSFWQKIGCVYCGYANGLAAYIVKIAGDTEYYWCGIKHKYQNDDYLQEHQNTFLNYDDAESFKRIKLSETKKNRGLKDLQ